MASHDNLKVHALGRPFNLGMLYDARSDKIIPGITLWDYETLKGNINEDMKPYSNFKMTKFETLEEKSSLLNVEASMKASFLSGLVEVGGSAKYLNDKKKSQKQNRLTLQYKATTTYKYLSTVPLKAKSMEVEDLLKGSATHVVTGILYGANAFFVFESDGSESGNIQNIEGKIEAAIDKIPKVSVGGQVSLELNDAEKSLANNLSCKFYGDFILESNPTTLEEALKTCQQFSKLLHESEVPMKVTLMPLKKFVISSAELKNGDCIRFLSGAEKTIENMREMEMRCNDSLEDKVVGKFSQISEKMSSFKELCNNYTSELQKTMKEKFPAIRAGEEDESSVEKLFDDRDKSPFSQERLNKWMSDKEREINVIKSCVGIMENTPIAANQSELDEKALAPGVEHVLCFTFTSLGRAEPYLEELKNYICSHNQNSTEILPQTTQDQWYSSNEVITKMRENAKTFNRLFKALKSSKVSFLIAAVENEKYKGASIYHYKKGILVTDNFSQPALPPVETITNREDLMWYACDLNLDPNTVNDYLTLSEENKKATYGSWQYHPSHPEKFDKCPQVLCREGLTGKCYWEVELSKENYNEVGVGVAYKGIARKSSDLLGRNAISWYLGKSGGLLHAWHKGEEVWKKSVPTTGCERVGVYLNSEQNTAHTLSFYRVSPNINTVSHLHTFHTKEPLKPIFTESVYPGFYINDSNGFAALCQVV